MSLLNPWGRHAATGQASVLRLSPLRSTGPQLSLLLALCLCASPKPARDLRPAYGPARLIVAVLGRICCDACVWLFLAVFSTSGSVSFRMGVGRLWCIRRFYFACYGSYGRRPDLAYSALPVSPTSCFDCLLLLPLSPSFTACFSRFLLHLRPPYMC